MLSTSHVADNRPDLGEPPMKRTHTTGNRIQERMFDALTCWNCSRKARNWPKSRCDKGLFGESKVGSMGQTSGPIGIGYLLPPVNFRPSVPTASPQNFLQPIETNDFLYVSHPAQLLDPRLLLCNHR